MTRMLRLLVVFSLLAPATASARPRGPLPQTEPPPLAEVKPVSAELPDVVARINGDAISRTDLESALAQMQARVGQPVPAEQRDRVLRSVLDQLIAFRLLVQESATRNIAVPEADLDARLTEIRSQFQSDDAFQQALGQRKLTLDGLRTSVRHGMQVDRMLDAEAAGAPVTPQQVEEFYTSHPSEFAQGERVRASHILIRVPQNADAGAREPARAKAAGILKDVKGGQDFAALAREHSEDPGTAQAGGDLGYFERGQMVGAFEEAAFALAPAQMSDLVETQYGFHIIKVDDKQPARTIPLAEVREQVEQFLQGRNREERMETFVETLKTKGTIEILI